MVGVEVVLLQMPAAAAAAAAILAEVEDMVVEAE